MSTVRVLYDAYTEVTRERNPNDEWDNDDTSTSISIRGIELVDDKEYNDFEVPFDVKAGKVYFLVYARYSTGDSFSHHEGKHEFIDLFKTDSKARLAVAAIKKAKKADRWGNTKEQDVTEYSYKREDGSIVKCGWAPWVGYFESLDDIYLEAVLCKR